VRAEPISGAVGVELVDLDLTKALTTADLAAVRSLYTDAHLILVRGQQLTRRQYVDFVDQIWPVEQDDADTPRITSVSNVADADTTGPGPLLYHQDEAFRDRVCYGISLYANHVSDDSSPTSFASATRPLSILPDVIVDELKSTDARSSCLRRTTGYASERASLHASMVGDGSVVESAVHPVLIPTGRTDETALFISEQMTSHLCGMEQSRSDSLLARIWTEMYSESNVYTHRWQSGDVVVWNNIAVQHGRPNVAGIGPRDFWRLKTYAPLPHEA